MYLPVPARPDNSNDLLRLDFITRQWYESNDITSLPKRLLPGYKVHPQIELERKRYYLELKHEFYKILNHKNLTEKSGLFDRWIWSQLLLQPEELDSLIPYSAITVDPRIEFELINSYGFELSDVRSKLESIATISKKYSISMNNYSVSFKLSDAKIIPEWKPNVLYLKYNNTSMSINKSHYMKLKNIYNGNSFLSDLYCLLLRYYTLGIGGYQAAAPRYIFEYLESTLGVTQECFSSPLNCYFDKFCSAFYDTDHKFGSIGSFFRFTPDEGSYEVNPPFSEVVMHKMSEHVEYLLSASKKKLTFYVIVPKWDDDGSPMWLILNNSKFLVKQLDIDKGHSYYTGNQHITNYKCWKATHITTIFVLQNYSEFDDDALNNLATLWSSK